MGSDNTITIGKRAEQTAFRFLLSKGLQPVTRNFRSRGGEIDLIMLHGNCLAFVEVRYRRSAHFWSPGATVNHLKQQKIVRTAAQYLATKRRYARHATRFDVVSITGSDGANIEWIQDAFRPNDSTF